ncbi:MAG: hypothetical protein AB7Q97_02070 [Gammaproteobacteria bacterium]
MSALSNVVPSSVPATEPVFVFGTNTAGNHVSDSAALAQRFHGAEPGKWTQACGNSYAIPFRNGEMRPMPPDVLRSYVHAFLQYAESRPDLAFHVARFGCEQEAFDDPAMASMFRRAPKNCALPGIWERELRPDGAARLLVYDAAGYLKEPRWQDRLQTYLNVNAPLWGAGAVELVSVGSARNLVGNDAAARRLKLRHRIIGPNPGWYGDYAHIAAELKAIWYSTHLLCISDFNQTSQPNQIRLVSAATRGGLFVDQMDAGAEDDSD